MNLLCHFLKGLFTLVHKVIHKLPLMMMMTRENLVPDSVPLAGWNECSPSWVDENAPKSSRRRRSSVELKNESFALSLKKKSSPLFMMRELLYLWCLGCTLDKRVKGQKERPLLLLSFCAQLHTGNNARSQQAFEREKLANCFCPISLCEWPESWLSNDDDLGL